MNAAAPWSRNPPVAWWQLWPGNAAPSNNPAAGYPHDGKRFFALPVWTGLSIAADEEAVSTVSLPDLGWTFRMSVIAITHDPDLFLSIVDIGSGRKIVTDANVFAFVGGEGGRSFVTYPYQFTNRSSIGFTLRNRGGGRKTVDCAVMGQYFRGVV